MLEILAVVLIILWLLGVLSAAPAAVRVTAELLDS
jgi:hypothetical protein